MRIGSNGGRGLKLYSNIALPSRHTVNRCGSRFAFEWAKANLLPQRLTVCLDGNAIFNYNFSLRPPFEPIRIPFNVSAGAHDLTIEYFRWDGDDPAKPAAVAFESLQVLPDNAPE